MRYQQVATLDEETGELIERRLEHERESRERLTRPCQQRCG
jgi:hypothetical protein